MYAEIISTLSQCKINEYNKLWLGRTKFVWCEFIDLALGPDYCLYTVSP